MSKLKDTLLMMAVEKETFEVNGKTFQIIEVVEAEQPQPDYSHLVGKWVKATTSISGLITANKWYKITGLCDADRMPNFLDDDRIENGFNYNGTNNCFDLTNPQDQNPDEVKKILVPSEIVISEDVDGLNLHFGNNQALYVYKGADGYGVLSEADREPIQCELIKCERAEFKKGDLAFRTDEGDTNFEAQILYGVVIDENTVAYVVNNSDVCTDSVTPWKHWYKLQPIKQ